MCAIQHGWVPVAGRFVSARGKLLSFALFIALCASTWAFTLDQCCLLQGGECSVFRIHGRSSGDISTSKFTCSMAFLHAVQHISKVLTLVNGKLSWGFTDAAC